MAVDDTKLQHFMERMVGEFGAMASAPLVLLGDRLGLYKAMAGQGAMTPAALAQATQTAERYVREWLLAQAAAGFITYDAATGLFSLPPEQAACFADDDSPTALVGFYEVCESMFRDVEKVARVFHTGLGLGWHEHSPVLFSGTERFFRPGYAAFLVSQWLPSMPDAIDRLRAGGRVADVGCGHGASTLLMAQAFPEAHFLGFDYHDASIDRANERAEAAGLADRVQFLKASAKDYPGEDYDLVTFFDCLHDMGDPVGAAKHVRESLSPEGTWMIVEPFAHDRNEDNMNPVGRIFYAASTMICTPASLSQEVGLGLGAQAGEARLREVVSSGGFTRFRRAAETPFNLILEARP